MKTNYTLNDKEKEALKEVNKSLIDKLEEIIDLYHNDELCLYGEDGCGEFDVNKFHAILIHLGLTY